MDAEGATPPTITQHPFTAEPWWSECTTCGLSMAAHTSVDLVAFEAMRAEISCSPYRCVDCVSQDLPTCDHRGEGSP